MQRHRGPDAYGEWVPSGRDVFLGHQRLSILDLSEHSSQPMIGASGKVLVYNGEIYNFRSVRDELEQSGCVFKSTGDTEVLLQALENWGTDGLVRLEGMFAFLLWDPQQEEALIARDFFGIKPLYLLRLPNRGLAVSSEIKSFYALPEFEPQIDTELLPEYLRFRCIAGERTLLKDVLEVLPGHVLNFRRATGELRSSAYWDASSMLGRDVRRWQTSQARDHLQTLFTETIQRHLIADVPVGMQFSGGVDSSLVSAVAAEELHTVLKGFHCQVLEAEHDESPFAAGIGQALGMQVETVGLSHQTLYSGLLEKLTWHLDEPLMHPNSMGIYLISQLAYGRVKVLLSGEAADEFFAGYARYPLLLLQDLLRERPFVRTVLGSVCGPFSGVDGRIGTILNVVQRSEQVDLNEQIISGLAFVGAPVVGDLLRRSDVDETSTARRRSLLDPTSELDLITRCRLFDIKTYLPSLFLRQDKMSMAASIENRVPFATPDMFAAAFSIPARLSANIMSRKEILKSILENYLPRKWVRRQKGGFGIPLHVWFLTPEGRERLNSMGTTGSPLSSVMDRKKINDLVSGFSGTMTAADVLWTLLSLQVWMEVFCNRDRCLEFSGPQDTDVDDARGPTNRVAV